MISYGDIMGNYKIYMFQMFFLMETNMMKHGKYSYIVR
jgi:hypothetical protein